MARIYAQSLCATLAAVAPLLASYVLWAGPATCGLTQAATMVLTGVLCWLAVMRLVRHPLLEEVLALLAEILAALPWRKRPAST
jgi:hypothetical protein